ncbi:MAG TPA: pyrroloquinoline quinone biosynthesis protein PqqB [Rudaea sp.]|jgi:pyrroloquinoline quinone biosynthesis protein B
MRVHVLGSAAGGGFPQWNCNCRLCDGLRRGTLRARARTQSSIALTGDGDGWLLCNASPDILTQLRSFAAAHPARTLRDTAIAAVLLIDAQIDHTTGLCMLREHTRPLPIWCTDPVHEDLRHGYPLLNLLGHYCGTARHTIPLDGSGFEIDGVAGVRLTALPLRSNAPPYSPHRDRPVPGDNIGLVVESVASGKRLFYAPGLGEMEPPVWSAMQLADVVLVDGTCWRDDELVALGVSRKRARDMGHLPQDGDGGMLEWLGRLPAQTRRILIHINNTNPVLDEDGPEHVRLREAGVELAFDGMEIEL